MSLQYKTFYKAISKNTGSNDFIVTKMELLGKGVNCFNTPEEAQKHFDEALEKAYIKFDKILEGIQNLKEKLGGFSIDYFIEGDLYGIEQEGKYIEFEIDGYNFEFRF
ncbi:MAG TPA: hypothetical protein PLM63_04140 [bacterium]|nr:hypothetical protein [bacterium]